MYPYQIKQCPLQVRQQRLNLVRQQPNTLLTLTARTKKQETRNKINIPTLINFKILHQLVDLLIACLEFFIHLKFPMAKMLFQSLINQSCIITNQFQLVDINCFNASIAFPIDPDPKAQGQTIHRLIVSLSEHLSPFLRFCPEEIYISSHVLLVMSIFGFCWKMR